MKIKPAFAYLPLALFWALSVGARETARTVNLDDAAPKGGKISYELTGIEPSEIDSINFQWKGKNLRPLARESATYPLLVGFLLDASGSLGEKGIRELKQSTKSILEGLEPKDEVAVWSFADALKFDSRTGKKNIRDLNNLLAEFSHRGKWTRLYDVLPKVLGELRAEGTKKNLSPVLILITDGVDERSKSTLAQANAEIRRRNVPLLIYAIQGNTAPNNSVLESWSADSRGEYSIDSPVPLNGWLKKHKTRVSLEFEAPPDTGTGDLDPKAGDPEPSTGDPDPKTGDPEPKTGASSGGEATEWNFKLVPLIVGTALVPLFLIFLAIRALRKRKSDTETSGKPDTKTSETDSKDSVRPAKKEETDRLESELSRPGETVDNAKTKAVMYPAPPPIASSAGETVDNAKTKAARAKATGNRAEFSENATAALENSLRITSETKTVAEKAREASQTDEIPGTIDKRATQIEKKIKSRIDSIQSSRPAAENRVVENDKKQPVRVIDHRSAENQFSDIENNRFVDVLKGFILRARNGVFDPSGNVLLDLIMDGGLDPRIILAQQTPVNSTQYLGRIMDSLRKNLLDEKYKLLPQIFLESIGHFYPGLFDDETWEEWFERQKKIILEKSSIQAASRKVSLEKELAALVQGRLRKPVKFHFRSSDDKSKDDPFQEVTTYNMQRDYIKFVSEENYPLKSSYDVKWSPTQGECDIYIVSSVKMLCAGKLYQYTLAPQDYNSQA